MAINPPAQLVYCPHPLLPAADRQVIVDPVRSGESLTDYLARHSVSTAAARLTIGGREIARAGWGDTYPAPGEIIHVYRVVQGGGGSNPLRTILTLAVLIAAPYAGNLLFPTSAIAAGIATATVGLAGMLVVNALVPPDIPSLAYNSEDSTPVYSVAGGANRARPYQPLPLVLGRHRLFPDLAAREYTEFSGEDQYLYQLFHFGVGELNIDDVRIGHTPIGDYEEVTTQLAGAAGTISLMPGNVDTIEGAALDTTDWVTRTSSIDSERLAVDLVGTLFRAGDQGLEHRSARFAIEYRGLGDNDWYREHDITLSNATRTPLRRTYPIQPARTGQFEVRVKRLSALETDSRNTAEFQWTVLRSYQPDQANYQGQQRLAIKIKATGQLQGRIDRLSALAHSNVFVFNNGAWVRQPSSNPAWLFYYFARGIDQENEYHRAGQKLVAGCGLPATRVDVEVIKLWAAFCDREQLECNLVLTSPRSRADVLRTIARCGRAAPTWQSGKLGVVWDAAGRPVTAVFGMSNIVSGSFRIEYATEQLADEIVARYIEPDADWNEETVRVLLPGVQTPQRSVEITLAGITNRKQATAEANLQAARQRYHRKRYSWEVELEGLVVERGDVVILSHDLTQWSYSGRVLAGSTEDRVIVSRTLPNTTGSRYLLIRHSDGAMETREVAEIHNEGQQIMLVTALDKAPDTEALWFFDSNTGRAGVQKKVKIIDYEPVSETRVRLVAIDEVDDYYEAKDLPGLASVLALNPKPPKIHHATITEQLVRIGQGFGVELNLVLSVSGDWAGAVVYQSINSAPEVVVATLHGTTRASWAAPATGTVQLRIVPGTTLVAQGQAYTVSYTIVGKARVPSAVDGFQVWRQPDGTRVFEWNAVADVDVIGYEIRAALGRGHTDVEQLPKIHSGLLTSSPWETNLLTQGIYTAAIQAVDSTGHKGLPSVIVAEIGEPRGDAFAYAHAHLEGWPGTIDNGVRDDINNTLTITGDGRWEDTATWVDTKHWGGQQGVLVYTHPIIDLEHVLTWHPAVVTDTENGQALVELRTSNDQVSWSDWSAPAVSGAGRYIQLRVTVTPESAATAPAVLKVFSFTAFGNTLSEVISDADTSAWQSADTGYPKGRYFRIYAVDSDGALEIAQFQMGPSRDAADDLARGILPEVSSVRTEEKHLNKGPENATDGNPGTFWASSTAGDDPHPWLLVDLGEVKVVGNIFINNAGWGFPHTFEIQKSDNKISWETVYRGYRRNLGNTINHKFDDTYTGSNTNTPGIRMIPATRTYSYITSVQVALQGVGAGWSWEVLQKHPLPVIAIYDQNGNPADANIDVVITGVAQ